LGKKSARTCVPNDEHAEKKRARPKIERSSRGLRPEKHIVETGDRARG